MTTTIRANTNLPGADKLQHSLLTRRPPKRLTSVGTFATDDSHWRLQKNFQIIHQRLAADVLQVHPDHFVKRRAASALDLTNARYSRFHIQHAAAVPAFVH